MCATGRARWTELDGFEPVEPDAETFSNVDARARAGLRAGISEIRRGELDVSAEMLERLEALADIADGMPAPIGSRAAQEAAYLLGRAKDEQFRAIPFVESDTNAKSYFVGPDRRHRLRETDMHGRQREVVFDTTPETIPRPSERTPWDDPRRVTLAEFATWSRQDQHRFATEHADVVEGLKLAAAQEEALRETLWPNAGEGLQ
jgi:hypothetical protein